MPTLLKIDVSPRGGMSLSRQLGDTFVEAWQAAHSGGTVTVRDLATNQPTYVDLPWIAGAFSSPDQHTDEHKQALALSDELIAELKAADHILVTTPMYNLMVPAVLKAWIDHVVRVGVTFAINADHSYEGLVKGKKVTIIEVAGGVYADGTPFAAYDLETPYLKTIFGFIGMTDTTVIKAGGGNAVSFGKLTPQDFLAQFAGEVKAAAA